MTATAVAAGGWWLWRRAAGRRARLWPAALSLAAVSAPWWARALADPQALEMVSVSGRRAGLGEHLAATVPRMHEAVGGLLGTHVPLVADAAEHVVHAPALAAAVAVLVYGAAIVLAGPARLARLPLRRRRRRGAPASCWRRRRSRSSSFRSRCARLRRRSAS